jgi:NhaP-type Na+/H+ or K+/H+ antiporter
MILILITIMASVSFFCRLSFGGIVLRHYLEANVSRKAKTSIKYFMKMLANISETIIFMFLGLSTLGEDLDWNWSFICFSLLFCLVFRVLGK